MTKSENRRPTRLFKKLGPKNWRRRDKACDPFVRRYKEKSRKITNDQFASIILERSLSQKVPVEVRNLFEVAQGAMCYGCYFYPLYTLGSEQMYRVSEAAVNQKCKSLNIPRNIKSFRGRLNWLRDNNFLSKQKFVQWDAGRQLRNSASHPNRQSIYTPFDAINTIDVTIDLVEDLFQ